MTLPPEFALTEDLELAPLDLYTMRALLVGRRDAAAAALDAEIPDHWSIAADRWLQLRIRQVEADPSWAPWLLRSIVRRADRMLVGTVGFHGPPGSHVLETEIPGVVEFGYTVIDGFRCNGYAAAASRALMSWGADFGAHHCVLSIAPGNQASRRVAEKLGFARVREYVHESRGTEILYFCKTRKTRKTRNTRNTRAPL